jgi:plastocyanin
VAAALAAAGLATAAPALADQTITAGPLPNTYSTTDVTMDQGEAVLFQNSDSSGALHDVTADDTGADGKPLFKSALIEGGKSSPVDGVEYLTSGDYKFHCSVHNFMTGTIHVTANGTPKLRPVDTTPPTVSVAILDSRIPVVLKRGALKVRATSNEPTRFRFKAVALRKTIATGQATLSKDTRTRTVTISLTATGKRLLRKAKKPVTVKLSAAASDAADNRAAATATRKLKR